MIIDQGVLDDSLRFFHEADPFTKENLFYIERAGIYHCDSTYQFAREASEIRTCQMILVEEGCLQMQYGGEQKEMCPGDMILMHLGEPHLYRTAGTEVRMIWMHMDGRGCLPYVRLITGTGGNTMKLRRYPGVREILDRIFILLDKSDGMDPHELSVCVHYFFSLMMRSAQERFETEIERSIRESAAYIRVNYAKENLSVPHLADREAMSVSYYVRSFRKIMGVTPHQYILQARINAARELLDTTSLSVETIAEHSGFCSASHLISAFRKETGMTPLQFRNLWR